MAQFSYAPVSIEIKRAIRKKSRIELDVLDELCNHADPLGMCYPGHRRLADMTGRSEDSVKTALVNLGNQDLFRCHLVREGVRARATLTYQLNPHCVIYIREQLFDEACALWETAKSYSVILNLTEHVQPEQPEVKPDFQPEIKPHTQPQKPPMNGLHQTDKPDFSLMPIEKTGEGIKTPQPVKKDKKQGKALSLTNTVEHIPTHDNGTSHANGGNKDLTPPVAPAPPLFDLPLPDFDDEQTAQSLRVVGTGTKITRARQLVHQYGRAMVDEAVKQSDGKRNRIGFIVKALENGWIKPVVEDRDWHRYLFDQFGNPIDTDSPLSDEALAYRNARWGIGAGQ